MVGACMAAHPDCWHLEGMMLSSKDADQSLEVVTDVRAKPLRLIALCCIHVQ